MSTATKQAFRAARPIHLAGGGACAGIVAAAAVLVLLPGVRSRQEASAQFDRLEEVSLQLENAARSNRALSSQIQRVSESVESRRVPLDPQSELNRRLAALTAVCMEAGLTPESIQPQTPITGGVTAVVPIRFEVNGSPEAIYGLIGLFDDAHADMHLRSLTIEHVGPGTMRLRTVLDWHTAADG